MANITLGQISTTILFLVTLIGGIEFLLIRFKKIMDNQLKPIKEDLEDEKVARMKSTLVNYQALIENGTINQAQLANYYDMFDKYTNAGHNSYVHEGHEKLKKEGKL